MVYIHLHLVDFYGFYVGEYTSPMDPMGMILFTKKPIKTMRLTETGEVKWSELQEIPWGTWTSVETGGVGVS